MIILLKTLNQTLQIGYFTIAPRKVVWTHNYQKQQQLEFRVEDMNLSVLNLVPWPLDITLFLKERNSRLPL